MTSPVDPVRRSASIRRAKRAEPALRAGRDTDEAHPASEAAPHPAPDPAAEAAFAAQMIGQERRRGVRAGLGTLDSAKSAYTRTEWSGAADRRAKPGHLARTKI